MAGRTGSGGAGAARVAFRFPASGFEAGAAELPAATASETADEDFGAIFEGCSPPTATSSLEDPPQAERKRAKTQATIDLLLISFISSLLCLSGFWRPRRRCCRILITPACE